MSWLSPKHLEDVSRILRGVALVLARAAIDSAQNRAALSQARAAALKAAQVAAIQGQAQHAQPAAKPQSSVQVASLPSSNPLVSYLYPQTVQQLAQRSALADTQAAERQLVQPWHTLQELQHQQQEHEQQQVLPQMQEVMNAANTLPHHHQEQQQQHVDRLEQQASVVQHGMLQATAYPLAPAAALGPVQDAPQLHDKHGLKQHEMHPTADQAGGNISSSVSSIDTSAAPTAAAPHAAVGAAVGMSEERSASMPAGAGQQATVTTGGHPAAAAGWAASAVAAQSTAPPPPPSPPPPAAAAPERIESWMSGHESVTTAAEEASTQHVAAAAAAATQQQQQPPQQFQQQPPKVLRERRVPSTSVGRALGFAGMGASLLLGSLSDTISRSWSGEQADAASSSSSISGSSSKGVYSNFITESNAERLANALCRMRGAALKIGQMLSIQDETVLPPQIQSALERVRAGADVMPRSQLEGQLVSELGRDWTSQLAHFDFTPRAAASIGQVHAAVLHDGRQVAMKIQYPGVARSIESDVDNLMRLINIANILPRGLYVENAVKVAKRELALECNYAYEAAAQQRFRELVLGDDQLAGAFYVPSVIPELSSRQVLTTEWVNGVAIDKVAQLDQSVRDSVGSCLLRLTLRELYDWRFMQTDPNWGNFLYDQQRGVLNLIDFGAAKEFPPSFVDDYLRMVYACAERDRQGVVDMSVKLGFLTGDESAVMLDAHTEAGFVVGLPFATRGLYDFGAHSGMTPRVAELGSIMLKHRLTPPPEESYSLHRKLSGAFLACMKLRARVPCRQLFMETFDRHSFGGAEAAAAGEGGRGSAADTAGSDNDQHDMQHRATA